MPLTKQQKIRVAERRLDAFVESAEALPAGSAMRKSLLRSADLELDTLAVLGVDGRTKAGKARRNRTQGTQGTNRTKTAGRRTPAPPHPCTPA